METIGVLIVEDQAMLRESLVSTIDSQPDMHVVASLTDAAEAPAFVAGGGVDLALMDVCTENDSSGIVAAKRIKQDSPKVRVVIMTGMPDITFVEQARDAGVDSFVYKNVGISELLSVMRSTDSGYTTFPKAPDSVFSGSAALTDEEIPDSSPCLRGQKSQGDRQRALHERRHGQASHRRNPRQDGL